MQRPHDLNPFGTPRSNGRRSRWILAWIAATCTAPVIAAWLAYYLFKPAGGAVNSGVLIEPQRPVPPNLELWTENSATTSKMLLNTLRGKWLMLSVDASACTSNCVKKLYFMRQIRAAQGKERSRILTVWIRTDHAPVPFALQQAYRDTRFLIAHAPARAQLAQWLPTEVSKTYTDAIYLIDPNGNLMMRFSIDLDPAQIQKDLSRLLKWSGLG